jgi:hypothetical protein
MQLVEKRQTAGGQAQLSTRGLLKGIVKEPTQPRLEDEI